MKWSIYKNHTTGGWFVRNSSIVYLFHTGERALSAFNRGNPGR